MADIKGMGGITLVTSNVVNIRLCGGVGMKRFVVSVAIALMLLGTITSVAAEPKTIPGWVELRQDMELLKGALDGTVASEVLNTYLPGYGVVFLFSVKYGMALDDVQYQVERALRFITPTIGVLPEGEVIAIVGYSESLRGDWEIMYVSRADSSADPDTWDIYYNKK